MIKKIIIEIEKDKRIELTKEQTKKLYYDLKELFNGNDDTWKVIPWPYPVIQPTYPIITFDTGTTKPDITC